MPKKNKTIFQVMINTDGACAGNPGLMGIGGVIRQNYPEEKALTFSEPAGLGTNNEAEYLAVIKALEMTLPLQPESVIVKSDSQLVICQLTGAYRINYPHLARLHGKVKSLAKQFPGEVKFAWVPREQNKQADALASKAAGMPQAVIRGDKVIAWRSDYVPDKQQIANLPMTKPECRRGLDKLLNLGEKARFRDFAGLKTGGLDGYSKAKVEKLTEYAGVRFGVESVEWLEEAAGGFGGDYGKAALRWVARGLPPDLVKSSD
ncbi:MAG TPA: ribonuclease HI family protein [Bacillota bacterium]|nr:ribonuclease HI family protein [Bacillota bacterium]